jgi:hypothetical protein
MRFRILGEIMPCSMLIRRKPRSVTQQQTTIWLCFHRATIFMCTVIRTPMSRMLLSSAGTMACYKHLNCIEISMQWTTLDIFKDNIYCFVLAPYSVGLANMFNRKLASDLSSGHQAGAHSTTHTAVVVGSHLARSVWLRLRCFRFLVAKLPGV